MPAQSLALEAVAPDEEEREGLGVAPYAPMSVPGTGVAPYAPLSVPDLGVAPYAPLSVPDTA
eukprot:2561619-Rhodomonas_salina.1